jgi:hypothetical protein
VEEVLAKTKEMVKRAEAPWIQKAIEEEIKRDTGAQKGTEKVVSVTQGGGGMNNVVL